MTIVDAEWDVRVAANKLAEAERKLAETYLLNLATGKPTWQAQKMAEVELGPDLRRAQAEYEIALARLRRA